MTIQPPKVDMRDEDAILACEEAMEPSIREALDAAMDAGWDRKLAYDALLSVAVSIRRADMDVSQTDD